MYKKLIKYIILVLLIILIINKVNLRAEKNEETISEKKEEQITSSLSNEEEEISNKNILTRDISNEKEIKIGKSAKTTVYIEMDTKPGRFSTNHEESERASKEADIKTSGSQEKSNEAE